MRLDEDEDDEEEDFIESSKKRFRMKKEEEREAETRRLEKVREEEAEQREKDKQKVIEEEERRHQEQPGPSNSLLSPSLDQPESTGSQHDSLSAKPSSLSAKCSQIEMPPPSTLPNKKKRPAEDEPAFLVAPTKRKKGSEVDPLDTEFNKLKLAKQNLVGDGREEDVAMGEEEDRFAMVCVVQPLLRKDARVERPVVDDGGVPNFKKFKKVSVLEYRLGLPCRSFLAE